MELWGNCDQVTWRLLLHIWVRVSLSALRKTPMVRGAYKRLPPPFTKLACVERTGRGSILLRPCNLGHVIGHIFNRKAPLPANLPCCQFLTLHHAPNGADADLSISGNW